MAKNGFEGLTVKTLMGNMPVEEYQRCPPEQRLLLRRPGWFAVCFVIAMAGVAAITHVVCQVGLIDVCYKLLGG